MMSTVGKRIAAGYAIILGLLAVVAAIGLIALPRTTEVLHSAQVQQSQRLTANLAALGNINGASENFLRYLLSPDGQYLSDWRTSSEAARRQLIELRDKSPNSETREGWTDILTSMDKLQQASQRSLDAKSAGNDNVAMRIEFDGVLPLRRQLYQSVDRVIASEQTYLTGI